MLATRCKSTHAPGGFTHCLVIGAADTWGEAIQCAFLMRHISPYHASIMKEAMHVSATQSDIMWLVGGTRDGVEVEAEFLVGDEWRGNIRVIVVYPRPIGHEALTTPGCGIC